MRSKTSAGAFLRGAKMAVDKIDPQLQSIISDAQLRSQKTANKDDQADAARKAAEKRQAEKSVNSSPNEIKNRSFEAPRSHRKLQN